MKTKRLDYIDAVAGVMIFWMVLGHCSHFSHIGLKFFKFLGFYMPWFYYKSGMFYNPKEQIDLIKKDINKFLHPFITYSLIGWGVWSICGMIEGTETLLTCVQKAFISFVTHGNIVGNGALWFLLSLFIVREFANIIIKRNLSLPLLIVICFLLSLGLYHWGWYNYSWWVGNIFSGLFFFLLGYWLKGKEDTTLLIILPAFIMLVFIIAHFTGLIDFPYLYMHANKMYNGNYVLFFIMAVAGIVVTNNLFKISYTSFSIKILEYIGRNSMNIYVTHWILFVLVSFIAKNLLHVESDGIHFLMLLGTSIIFLPVICNFINNNTHTIK